MKCLRIATRQSPLAIRQAQLVGQQLQLFYPEIEIKLVPRITSGDKIVASSLENWGGKGLFVKEIEQALLEDEADIAVHSIKDLPITLPEKLALVSILKRHSPYDALISHSHHSLMNLPSKSVVGTVSLRRSTQILSLRPDLIIKPLRGNINTRLAKLANHDYDAIVLAVAGLERLSLTSSITEVLASLLPACGQGALGVECLQARQDLYQVLACLNHPLTALCVHTERKVNAQLGGNCHVPLAVFCQPYQDELWLQAKVMSADGKIVISDSRFGKQEQTEALANQCSNYLLENGAGRLLAKGQL